MLRGIRITAVFLFCIFYLTSCAPRVLDREEITQTRKPDGSWSTTKTMYWKPAHGSQDNEKKN